MKIGILQTGHVPAEMRDEYGEYAAVFERLLGGHGFSFDAWSVVDGAFPSGPEDADGWLITGSRHGVYEDHAWLAPLEQLVRAIVASGKPLIGICFGHQLIAQALGGKVEQFAGGWAVGRQSYDMEDGGRITLNAWHHDQVIEPPAGARIIASNDFCKYAAMAIGDTVLTYQAHPEYTAEMIEGLFRFRPGVVPEAVAEPARLALHGPTDSAEIVAGMAEFLAKGAK